MKPRGAMAAHRWSRHAGRLPALYPDCWRSAQFRRAYNRAWMASARPIARTQQKRMAELAARDANLYAWRPAGFVCRAETTEPA